ncbi:MAG: ACP S-malonyltransferase [Bacteroidales bacterium]|nr:ACP S-malonyltransferase [Bacteroidales bacterium]
MKAFVFPGQGAQFIGMGKQLYTENQNARELFELANKLLGFNITDIMFSGTEEELKQTKVTQPAIFLHSVILARTFDGGYLPDMVAGHSLGEFSALVANQSLSFEDGLLLVSKRAMAMQKACEKAESSMAVVLGLDDEVVVDVCKSIENEIVIAANFNCPGQIALSGSPKGLELCRQLLMEKGAKRVLPLKVSGAFHSPFMEPARIELAEAIEKTHFEKPICPVYQNYTAKPSTDVHEIKQHLISQLTAPVLWTQSVRNMINDGATSFMEFGPGTVLQGLIKKIAPEAEVSGRS